MDEHTAVVGVEWPPAAVVERWQGAGARGSGGDEAGSWTLVVEVVDEIEEGRPAVPLAVAAMEGGSEMTQSQGSQTRVVRTR